MNDFSLDLAAERINHPKTKEYFREVMSSYAIGNYRSAVLSLYAIVISDLVYKLQDQVEREDDNGAQRILETVVVERRRDIFSSKWETLLVEKVFTETKLLELSDKANIEYLKEHRNLSAHPNILDTEDNDLFTPNKENVRAHIRNMLEGVLTKTSYPTAKLVDSIISKLPEMYKRVTDDSEYERVFLKRYLSSLNEKSVMNLFRKLWKFTYRLNDQDCQENRDVNGLTVRIITRIFPELSIRSVSEDQAYYSQVSFDKAQLDVMIELFNQAPRLFSLLDEDMQKQMKDEVKRFPVRYVRSWFLSPSIEDHCTNVAQFLIGINYSNMALWEFKNLAEEADKMDEYRILTINYLSKSSSYVDTYDRFRQVRQCLDGFNKEQIEELFRVMNSNRQIYGAQYCTGLIDEIQDVAEKNLGSKIDLSPFPKLR